MYEQEDGEVSNESDELSDDEERDGDVVECMATSLFDALAAAQEASERYQHLDSDGPREDHRLSEIFFTKAFKCAIKRPWRDKLVEKEGQEAQAPSLEDIYRTGYRCEAIWPGDNNWYPARIIRAKNWKQRVVVHYCGFDDEEEEEVTTEQIRGLAKDRKRCNYKVGKWKRVRKRKSKKAKISQDRPESDK